MPMPLELKALRLLKQTRADTTREKNHCNKAAEAHTTDTQTEVNAKAQTMKEALHTQNYRENECWINA